MSYYDYTQTMLARNVDRAGFLTPSELMLLMQEAGAAHSDVLHFGATDLLEKNLGWVITRALVKVDRYPKYGEVFTIRTWPGKPRLALFPRYYAFYVGEELIGGASTLYAMMDLTARTIAKPDALGRPMPIDNDEKPLPYPGNILLVDSEPVVSGYHPVYSDFDINGHVNNTRYIGWFTDQYPLEKHESEQLSSLLIHFDHEIRPNQDVRFERREKDEASVFRCFVGDTNCFSVEGRWSARVSL